MFSKAVLYEKLNIDFPATQHYDMTKLNPEQMYIYPPQAIPAICGMNISRPACLGSTAEASKVRRNRKIFELKKFILPYCLDSATPPRPNERDPNSRAVKMHRKEEKKRRGKGKRKEKKIGDQPDYFIIDLLCKIE